MKLVAVIACTVLASYLLAQLMPHAPPDLLQNEGAVKLMGAVIFALPIIGLVMAVRQFSRWHRGWHAKMSERGRR